MKKIRLTESQLHRVIKESVKKILRENDERTDIYTISIFDVDEDEGIDNMKYAHSYYDIDEAIEDAENIAREYSDDSDVILVSVMGGEYETQSGDIYGEPDAIYTASNKDERTTMMSRKQNGYVSAGVDFYAQ